MLRSLEGQNVALSERIAGKAMPEIAAQLGIGVPAVSKLLDKARTELEGQRDGLVERRRTIQGERLEQLFAAWWPAACDGDYKAAQVVLKANSEYRALFG